MRFKAFISFLFSILIFNSCKNTKTRESNKIDTIPHPWEKSISTDNAKILIDSVTKNIKDNDIILYQGDKGFYIDEANRAQKFVVKVLKLENTDEENISCGYFPNDSSYFIKVDRKLNSNKLISNFYKFYPKTKIILNGVTLDTVYHK
jgi:hypothetical protein